MGVQRTVNVFGTRLVIAKTPPWSQKGFVLRGYPSTALNPTAAQLRAQLALAQAAIGARGTRGKVPYKGRLMPGVAVRVAQAVQKGVGSHGGMSPQARAQQRQAASQANVARMQGRIGQAPGSPQFGGAGGAPLNL